MTETPNQFTSSKWHHPGYSARPQLNQLNHLHRKLPFQEEILSGVVTSIPIFKFQPVHSIYLFLSWRFPLQMSELHTCLVSNYHVKISVYVCLFHSYVCICTHIIYALYICVHICIFHKYVYITFHIKYIYIYYIYFYISVKCQLICWQDISSGWIMTDLSILKGRLRRRHFWYFIRIL